MRADVSSGDDPATAAVAPLAVDAATDEDVPSAADAAVDKDTLMVEGVEIAAEGVAGAPSDTAGPASAARLIATPTSKKSRHSPPSTRASTDRRGIERPFLTPAMLTRAAAASDRQHA